MNYIEKTSELRQIIKQQLHALIDSDYAYLELPYYENIGDTLIWEGTRIFLKQIKYKCLYSASLTTFYNHKIPQGATILLQGGGNFGDLWKEPHSFRKKIIELYPNNKVIIFPQTVWYENHENIKADEIFFANHPSNIFPKITYYSSPTWRCSLTLVNLGKSTHLRQNERYMQKESIKN